MKKFLPILCLVIGVGAVTTFQNCSRVNVQGSDQMTPLQSVSSDGNSTISNSRGEKIRFENILNIPVGRIEVQMTTSSALVSLKNELSGRSAEVEVIIDVETGKFLRVEPVGKPYLCFDDSRPLCDLTLVPPGFRHSGLMLPNCSSPIYFVGTLNGSVQNLDVPIDYICGDMPWNESVRQQLKDNL